MLPGGGRSRGRARTASRQEPLQVQPGTLTTPTTPTTPTALTNLITNRARAQSQSALPTASILQQRTRVIQQHIIQPETGRGRASATISSSQSSRTNATGPTSPITTSSESPNESLSESPPLQHSPSIGRAALRGKADQPIVSRNILNPLMSLNLDEAGGVGVAEASVKPRIGLEKVIVTRPVTCLNKKGSDGSPIELLSNCFQVVSKPGWLLYQYHVDFLPEIDSKKQRFVLFNTHREIFKSTLVFDGMVLYSMQRLANDITELFSLREIDNEIIMIKITHVSEITPTMPQFVQIFNLVFKKCLKHYGMKMIGRDYYDTKKRIIIPNYKIELISGLSTSISAYDNNQLLLCAELNNKLVHKETILDQINKIFEECRENLNIFRERCCVELVGRIFMTSYDEKTYKIDDINWDLDPRSTFQMRANRDREAKLLSFVDYYRTSEIKNLYQPLLVVQPKAKAIRRGQTTPFLFVPELSILTGINDQMREDFRFKKALDEFTKIGPADRCSRLTNFVQTFNEHPKVKEELSKWNMSFNSDPTKITARTLPPQSLLFGNNRKKILNDKANWDIEIKSEQLLDAIPLKKWILIYPVYKEWLADDFIDNFNKVIRFLGIPSEKPSKIALDNDQPSTIATALKNIMSDRLDIRMVVFLVTSKRKDRYDAIKRLCCIETPVPSQVITTAIIEDPKKKMAVMNKVAIQMNCKLGGSVWALNIPIKDVMICGIDTYHDSAKKNSSVCAFIATSDQNKTKFFSRATIQETHNELSNNLTLTVKSACEFYQKTNGKYPAKIIIYRDGVSDGQLKMVLEYEIPQIKKAFPSLDLNYNPLLTFIVVKKRGNMRFFTTQDQSLVNPPCGTVIDTVVTRPEWFDFYLVPQLTTQGTVNPTHFNIIYDTYNLKPDYYQRLSYKLTHMYYNWPGTIRVPAPCQYAHKLAFLVGQSLHKEHHSSLCDKLFFL